MLIDLTMTATRRPALIEQTLRSFSEKLLRNFTVGTFYLNLDPVWGTLQDHQDAIAVARSFVEHVVIRSPETPSFGGAVKWLWSQPQSEWFLHLEDDWELSRPVSPTDIARDVAAPDLVQVRLHNWKRLQRRRRPPTFTTSPSFTRGNFAALSSRLMNPELDPEKQFRNDRNVELRQAVRPYRVAYFGNRWTRQTAIDIGRSWRETKRIQKTITDGASVWS